jgi:hypothetical protein
MDGQSVEALGETFARRWSRKDFEGDGEWRET